MLHLELLEADTTKVAVPSRGIVENIDVVGNIRQRDVVVRVNVLLESLLLHAAKEGLDHGLVPTGSFPAHVWLTMKCPAEALPRIAAEVPPP